MVSAIQSALSGLNLASTRLNQAASDIVRSGAQQVAAASSEPGGFVSAAPLEVGSAQLGVQEGPSLTESVVSLKEAEILYKASAKLLGSLNTLQGELLEVLS